MFPWTRLTVLAAFVFLTPILAVDINTVSLPECGVSQKCLLTILPQK